MRLKGLGALENICDMKLSRKRRDSKYNTVIPYFANSIIDFDVKWSSVAIVSR
jgi:hypothetical protein